jgi:hypothetical protein
MADGVERRCRPRPTRVPRRYAPHDAGRDERRRPDLLAWASCAAACRPTHPLPGCSANTLFRPPAAPRSARRSTTATASSIAGAGHRRDAGATGTRRGRALRLLAVEKRREALRLPARQRAACGAGCRPPRSCCTPSLARPRCRASTLRCASPSRWAWIACGWSCSHRRARRRGRRSLARRLGSVRGRASDAVRSAARSAATNGCAARPGAQRLQRAAGRGLCGLLAVRQLRQPRSSTCQQALRTLDQAIAYLQRQQRAARQRARSGTTTSCSRSAERDAERAQRAVDRHTRLSIGATAVRAGSQSSGRAAALLLRRPTPAGWPARAAPRLEPIDVQVCPGRDVDAGVADASSSAPGCEPAGPTAPARLVAVRERS